MEYARMEKVGRKKRGRKEGNETHKGRSGWKGKLRLPSLMTLWGIGIQSFHIIDFFK